MTTDYIHNKFLKHYLNDHSDAPCPGCGAEWIQNSDNNEGPSRQHTPNCRYLAWIDSEPQAVAR